MVRIGIEVRRRVEVKIRLWIKVKARVIVKEVINNEKSF